jgi:tetratricopeptide (TPR) repeat protein
MAWVAGLRARSSSMRAALLLLGLFSAALAAQTTKPDALLKQAIDEQQRGDFSAAILDYQKFLESRPNEVQAKVNLGATLAQVGKYDEAIGIYLSVLPALKNNKDMVRMNLALAYYKKGDYQHAHDLFTGLQKAHPNDVRTLILLGDTDLHLGNPEAALALLQPQENRYSQNMDFEYVLGSALIQSGRKREGASRVEKSAQAGPSPDAYMLAGATYLDLDEFDKARRDLEKALRLNPALPGIHTSVGIARDKAGDQASAEAAFREALKLNPDDFDANLYLGSILSRRHDIEQARLYLDKALRLNPSDRVAHYESAMLKSRAGDYSAAVGDLEQLSKEDPDWLPPHIELAALYYKLHRPEDGKKERELVDSINAKQQSQGPSKP